VPMNLCSFRNWIRRIYATRDNELDCDLVFDAIAPYVDAEIAGHDPAQRYPAVAHHLSQCPACTDLYLALREAAQAEQEEEAASLVSVPRAERPQPGD
jgi:predicted anti-sigma-YlaC factor YlaD